MFSIEKVSADCSVPASGSERIERFLNEGFANDHLRFQVFMAERGIKGPCEIQY
jgi:hypothetical protein